MIPVQALFAKIALLAALGADRWSRHKSDACPAGTRGCWPYRGPSIRETTVEEIVLSLRECTDGWCVFQGQSPLFWFPDYAEAITTARMVATVHVDIREVSASIEMQMLGEQSVHVATLVPG